MSELNVFETNVTPKSQLCPGRGVLQVQGDERRSHRGTVYCISALFLCVGSSAAVCAVVSESDVDSVPSDTQEDNLDSIAVLSLSTLPVSSVSSLSVPRESVSSVSSLSVPPDDDLDSVCCMSSSVCSEDLVGSQSWRWLADMLRADSVDEVDPVTVGRDGLFVDYHFPLGELEMIKGVTWLRPQVNYTNNHFNQIRSTACASISDFKRCI